MIPVSEALSNITGAMRRTETETVSLDVALGRALAADASANMTQPPVAVSAMDGYAVCANDVAAVPVTLDVIGESAAGHGFAGTVNKGQATRIFTGAPVPNGADTIVIQENTTRDGDMVTVNEAPRAHQFVRAAGLDFRQGDALLRAPKKLTARDLGLAAAMNVPELTVYKKPRVAILATGDELVMPGEAPGPGQIISSNTVALAAYVTALGGEPVNLGIARDNEESLRAMLKGAKGADLLVTIGGASVGDHDLVQKVLGDEGLDLTFYKVAMRPGKPLIFGALGKTPVLGLPGNPVSVGVTSVLFLKPAIETMLGLAAETRLETATLGRDLDENDQRQDYLRAELGLDDAGALMATPFDKQDSSMMAMFTRADCLVIRAPHAPAAKAGTRVDIIRLSGGI